MDLHLRGICLLLLTGPVVGQAQDDESDVANGAAARAAEIESIGPGVAPEDLDVVSGDTNEEAPKAVLASDVRRSSSGNQVMDELELGVSEITGNQELPTVMYIVPWQKSDPGELLGKPVNSLLEEVLAPIDRSEFMRQVDYYGDLYKNDED